MSALAGVIHGSLQTTLEVAGRRRHAPERGFVQNGALLAACELHML